MTQAQAEEAEEGTAGLVPAAGQAALAPQPACHAASNAALLLALALAALALLAPRQLAALLARGGVRAAPHFLLPAPPAPPLPPEPPPAALPAPTPLPGPAALHPLLRGAACVYLDLAPTLKLELCPFASARLFSAQEEDWERFSSLAAATPCGAYSAGASGEGARQAFEGGAPCAGGGSHGATVDFVCDSEGGGGGGGGGGGDVGSPLLRLRAVSHSEPQPCQHAIVLATALLCDGEAGGSGR
jgi:hypothetical protein